MKEAPKRMRHATGKWMTLDPSRLLVVFRQPMQRKQVEEMIGAVGLVLEEGEAPDRKKRARPMEVVSHTDRRFWARTRRGGPIDDPTWKKLQSGPLGKAIEWVAPVYVLGEGKSRADYLSPLPHALLIKPEVRAGKPMDKELEKALQRYPIKEIPEKSRHLRGYRYFRITDPAAYPAYRLKAELEQDPAVADVRLEHMPLIVPTAFVPNDALYPDQWDMERIDAGGPGITGWNLSTGAATVTVCILDTGCDLDHPDLTFASPGINLDTMMPDGSPTGNHGTACAGIAAAEINNTLGVAGVAGGCQILPLAFVNWTETEVASGITYATDNGARVISMSFGWDPWDPALIDPAIQYAFDNNVVMCVATHNYDTADGITYPATNPLVMACGASDQDDNRKSPSSPDGETWGSNYGPEMSVVAPGVLIPTTDRQGTSGYNTSSGTAGDYYMMFNGTSSATPHVAGLAALLISMSPGLTNVEVRNIIEQTADKVGTVPYASDPAYPNGTWNEEMGYGRINVHSTLATIAKPIWKDFKDALIDKPFVFEKRPRFEKLVILDVKRNIGKEKERIDEVKGRIGYENPEFLGPRIFEHILERLTKLEQEVRQGRAFIRKAERPEVGRTVARRRKRKS